MKRLISIFLIIVLTGCSAFSPTVQTISVECSPDDSVLMINGQRYEAPVQLEVKRNKSVRIQASKKGYTPYRHTIDYHMNTLGILDLIGTCIFLIPVIGFIRGGAWSLDETEVSIQLFEEEGNA